MYGKAILVRKISPENKRLNICVVSHSYPFFKGDWRSNFIASLAEMYADLGNDVTVLTPFFSGVNRNADMGKKVRIETYRYMPADAFHVIGYGKSMKGDLSISGSALLLAPFLVFAGICKLTALLKKEKYDFIHCHWAVPNTLIAVAARRLSNSSAMILTSFPGSDVTVIRNTGFLGRILAKIISKSDYMSCNSSDLKDELVTSGIESDRIDYVIYGVDDSRISFSAEKRINVRSRWVIEDGIILLLMIGRFIPKKGFSTAFRALKHVVEKNRNVKLMVIGDGELKNEYISILRNDGTLEHAIFVGEIPTDELVDYYSACDIFLMPSEKIPPDGLNTVVPEAMACGRCVVASKVGGNDLVVLDGINGFLHKEGDHEDLAAIVTKMIENPALRARLGEKSVELVKNRFNWRSIAKYYIEKYKELHGKTHRPEDIFR
jgi:glycosyltransferase involved in cell wall biosynthesis